jgi:superfamily II DNA/RNA helicase
VAVSICSGPAKVLMFVRTQRGADRLVRQLDREGVRAECLHGGLSQPQRMRALEAFKRGHVNLLVATNVAARGLHIDGIDIVVHYDAPDDEKVFLHRSGRTARAGAEGLVVTLVTPRELVDFSALRRWAGLRESIVPMGPDDPRLRDLAGWEPPLDAVQPSRPAARSSAPVFRRRAFAR